MCTCVCANVDIQEDIVSLFAPNGIKLCVHVVTIFPFENLKREMDEMHQTKAANKEQRENKVAFVKSVTMFQIDTMTQCYA